MPRVIGTIAGRRGVSRTAVTAIEREQQQSLVYTAPPDFRRVLGCLHNSDERLMALCFRLLLERKSVRFLAAWPIMQQRIPTTIAAHSLLKPENIHLGQLANVFSG